MDIKCISCKRKITNLAGTVNFKCPNCNNYDIIRCVDCRKTVAKYVCPACNFTGPN